MAWSIAPAGLADFSASDSPVAQARQTKKPMNEAEWLASTDPIGMLSCLAGRASQRKLRLFACACCRHIWEWLPDDATRDLVAAVEDNPDGTFSEFEALVASSRSKRLDDGGYSAVKHLGRSFSNVGPLDGAFHVALEVLSRMREEDKAVAEEVAQAALLRDLFGNPFHPAAIDLGWLAWNDGVVPALARSIYVQRDFGRLPALAYALEGAGCDDASMLAHCSARNPHVRGCWVVDLLLGRQ